jgi:predicted lipoprotein with Yx(FWY)xxD motif
MRKSLIAAGLLLSALTFSATAIYAAGEPATVADTDHGKAWVDLKGTALYTFDKDMPGKSNCYDECAAEWPPLAVAAGATETGDWTIVNRNDGSKMWAYKGHPLYTCVDDKKPGQVTGDGVDDFHLAKA